MQVSFGYKNETYLVDYLKEAPKKKAVWVCSDGSMVVASKQDRQSVLGNENQKRKRALRRQPQSSGVKHLIMKCQTKNKIILRHFVKKFNQNRCFPHVLLYLDN